MTGRAEFVEHYFDGYGVQLAVEVRPVRQRFRATVLFNGCPAATATCSSFSFATTWGRWRADEILAAFGLGAAQLALPDMPAAA